MRKHSQWSQLIFMLVFILSVTSIYADCKLMGLIGLNGRPLTNTYANPNVWYGFTQPCLSKLKTLGANGTYPNNNPNGWGLISYCQETPTVSMIWRNNENYVETTHMAVNSQGYNQAISQLKDISPRIILGHVRNATNPDTDDLPDPHPFYLNILGKDFSFVHNGSLFDGSSATSVVLDLIDNHLRPEWLTSHNLDPQQYEGHYLDSEIYFYWIMQCVEDNNGDILMGLKIALMELTDDSGTSALNFILSDGYDLYAYRYTYNSSDTTHPLAYFYDIDEVSRNYFYCGVMSVFPNQWLTSTNQTCDTPNNIQAHAINNCELVYISSTGNIVRMPTFAHQYKPITNFWHKRDYHAGYNWEGFPILNIDINTHTAPISPYFDYFINSINGELLDVNYEDEHITPTGDPWSDNSYPMHMTRMYKMQFTSDSPSIHTTSFSYNQMEYSFIKNARMYDNSWYVIDGVIADVPYWISYTLLPTQNIADAFGENFNNVKSVKAENWYYEQYIAQGKSEGPIEDPSYMYTTEGKNMEFGEGYIVTFKNNMDYFSWNRSYIPEMPTPGKQKPEFFAWEDGPEYLVIDIYEAQNGETIEEVGAFQDDKCIGAVRPDKFPCQLLVYPDYNNPYPIEFQIIYKAKQIPKQCSSYQVYNPKVFDYFTDLIMPVENTNYIVKLTGDTPSQSVTTINPLVSLKSYPNPCNSQAAISFKLKYDTDVHVSIYNVKGQMVKDFGKTGYKSGNNSLIWNGTDYTNKEITGGIYFIKLESGKNILTHKMVVIR